MATHVQIPPPAVEILGVPVWGLKTGQFVELAVRLVKTQRKVLFTTTNAHSIVTAQGFPVFLEHFRNADVVLPDGILPVWAGKCLGSHLAERVPGPDFTDAFLEAAEKEGISLFFMGATEETLSRLTSNCLAKHPRLVIAGTLSPPFGEFDEETDRALVDKINASGADALFVGMTAPKQETWLSRNFERLSVRFMIGVGAAFDYLADTRKRVPPRIGRSGLEWLYRLVHEPRRLWRRNLDSAIFVWLVARHGRRPAHGTTTDRAEHR